MANISLLDMGKIKKRTVRETIISILSKEFPLNIKKIYSKIKKEYNLGVTYQAVFKIMKEMQEDNILEKSDKEYKLNINWIKDLENELEIIKKNYLSKKVLEEPLQNRINSFVSKLGPKIKNYVGKEEVCIIGISGPGKFFAIAISKYLLKEGIKVNYIELNKDKQQSQEKLILQKKDLENKKVIIVDRAIYSGKIFNNIMEKLSKVKKSFNIKDIKFIVDEDLLGLSDFRND